MVNSATWSQWTECLGSCLSTRRRVCSEHYGCNGLEYEEKKCLNTNKTCFQPLTDTLSKGMKEFYTFIRLWWEIRKGRVSYEFS